jgi:RNA polymerase sigma-70 factor, ECF subfamily
VQRIGDALPVEMSSADESERNEALALLLRTCGRRAFRMAADLLRDNAEAEDAVQEALARVCRDFASVRDPQAWFFRVLINLCLRAQRRNRLLTVWQRLWTPEPASGDPLTIREIRAAVDRLPPMQRTAIVLRYGHDQSPADIAALLGIGEGTVKTHLSRALLRLRKRMGA